MHDLVKAITHRRFSFYDQYLARCTAHIEWPRMLPSMLHSQPLARISNFPQPRLLLRRTKSIASGTNRIISPDCLSGSSQKQFACRSPPCELCTIFVNSKEVMEI